MEVEKDIDDTVNRLKQFRLLDTEQPFSKDRVPFSSYPKDVLEEAVKLYHKLPRKRGMLSDAIRRCQDENSSIAQDDFMRFEAHLNVATVRNVDVWHYVKTGFEEDDFAVLEPDCYERNFTFAFDVPMGESEHIRQMRRFLLSKCEEVAKYAQLAQPYDAFLEAEAFSSSNIRKFPRTSGKNLGDDRVHSSWFPKVSVVELPRTEADARQRQLPITTVKQSDLHIKLLCSHLDESLEPSYLRELTWITDLLKEAGFYKIVSFSGNTIFTAQFVDGTLAREFHEKALDLAFRSNLIASVVFEPCIYFWRRTSSAGGVTSLARVSPILVRS